MLGSVLRLFLPLVRSCFDGPHTLQVHIPAGCGDACGFVYPCVWSAYRFAEVMECAVMCNSAMTNRIITPSKDHSWQPRIRVWSSDRVNQATLVVSMLTNDDDEFKHVMDAQLHTACRQKKLVEPNTHHTPSTMQDYERKRKRQPQQPVTEATPTVGSRPFAQLRGTGACPALKLPWLWSPNPFETKKILSAWPNGAGRLVAN